MKLGVVSDIHGNAWALDAVLADGAAVGIGRWWVLGDLVLQAGLLDWLAALPPEQRVMLPDGSTLLGVHASPGSDDGRGISPDLADDELAELLSGCGADIVVGGHTHLVTDRRVNGMRVLNPGSAGLPRRGPGTHPFAH